MSGDRMGRERRRIVTMIRMAVDVVEEPAHMLAHGVIEEPSEVSLRTPIASAGADSWPMVVEVRRFGEEAGEVSYIDAVQDTADDVRKAFVLQNHQSVKQFWKW